VEHYEWMNEEVRKEIEDLQRTYGFDEDEALAYWHLRHAGTLLLAMRRTGTPERSEEGGGKRSARKNDPWQVSDRVEYPAAPLCSSQRARRSGVAEELPRWRGSAHKAIDE
jgi:hypothetical protein